MSDSQNEKTLRPGDPAPDFEVLDEQANPVRLSDFKGKKVVLLFYPMDFSSVCTKEHCAFGPRIDEIVKDDSTRVFGINADSPFSHSAFRKQYGIPYPLLSDPTRRMLRDYGMFAGEKPFNCSKRGTIVIDKEGKIAVNEPVEMLEERTVERLAALAGA